MEQPQILDLEVIGYIKCDACPGRARFGIILLNGKLDFCLHHYKKHEKAISEQAMQITEYPLEN
jgi:hypothetical protein